MTTTWGAGIEDVPPAAAKPVQYAPCDCADWQEGMPQIDAAQTLNHIRGGRYTGKAFRFCPWYGKERQIITE